MCLIVIKMEKKKAGVQQPVCYMFLHQQSQEKPSFNECSTENSPLLY